MVSRVQFFKVEELPAFPEASAFYYVLRPDGSFDQYLTTLAGQPVPAAGGDPRPYKHDQSAPAAAWIVNHNLGRDVAAVSVRTVGGVEMLADVVYVSPNQLRVQLAAPMRGSVIVI